MKRTAQPKTTKAKIGRPKLQDSTVLTDEMEEVAQLARSGFRPEEISEKLQIETTKVLILIQETPIVQARIKALFANKHDRWIELSDRLYEVCLDTAITLIKERKVPWQYLMQMLERLETRYGIIKGKTKRTISQHEEEAPDGRDIVPQQMNIFTKKTITVQEEDK